MRIADLKFDSTEVRFYLGGRHIPAGTAGITQAVGSIPDITFQAVWDLNGMDPNTVLLTFSEGIKANTPLLLPTRQNLADCLVRYLLNNLGEPNVTGVFNPHHEAAFFLNTGDDIDEYFY